MPEGPGPASPAYLEKSKPPENPQDLLFSPLVRRNNASTPIGRASEAGNAPIELWNLDKHRVVGSNSSIE
jgi:hypothetical protein